MKLPLNINVFSLRLLCLTILLVLVAACGSSDEPETQTNPTNTPEAMAEKEEAPTPEPTEEPTPEPTPEPVAESDEDDGESHSDSDSEMEMATDVFFRMPTNNAIVPTTFSVAMGAAGITIEPAGDIVENSGHMHILVNTPFIEAGNVIPADDQHIHFGDASLTAELTLPAGSHTLRLQLANGAHIALDGDQYRDEIVVTVKEDAPAQSVRFTSPLDGAVIPPTFNFQMAASGLLVDPAGEIIENSGHMHILIDTDFIEPGNVIPADDQHVHFGKAQLEAALDLTSGEHTLRLQMANGAHIALDGDQYRDEITVMVEEGAGAQSIRFVSPVDGDVVSGTFDVQMASTGLFVEAAGAVLREQGGHMHILIDADFIEAGNVVPKDDQHLHFGGGQTTTELTLEPGEYVLRLQMANGAHLALDGDQYRDEITITVSE
ncbi:MAG: DUF4399 domain-containing protein [Chloroflexota bacterium]